MMIFSDTALCLLKTDGISSPHVENVWNKFLLSPLQMREFVEQFDSDHVGVYFDIGNALAVGYPEHWIRILSRQVRRIHLKDYRRAVGCVHGFVEIFCGDVDRISVMKTLRAADYKG